MYMYMYMYVYIYIYIYIYIERERESYIVIKDVYEREEERGLRGPSPPFLCFIISFLKFVFNSLFNYNLGFIFLIRFSF